MYFADFNLKEETRALNYITVKKEKLLNESSINFQLVHVE